MHTPNPAVVPHHASTCAVRDVPHGVGLFATRAVDAGALILEIEGRVQPTPTRYSIQLDAGSHIEADAALADDAMRTMHPWRFLNHSCDPNARVEGTRLLAARPILAGEEITFDYNTTEARMAVPFDCLCGTDRCVGTVRGFEHLRDDQRHERADRLAPHLRAAREGRGGGAT